MRQVFMILAFFSVALPAQGFDYDSKGRRDPFWPLVDSNGVIVSYDRDISPSDMSLEGIFVGGDGNNVAIINGNIFKPGDSIGLFVITEIRLNAVVMRKGNETITLKLPTKED